MLSTSHKVKLAVVAGLVGVYAIISAISFFIHRSSVHPPGQSALPGNLQVYEVVDLEGLLSDPVTVDHLNRYNRLLTSMAEQGRIQELVEIIHATEKRKPRAQVWSTLGFALCFNVANLHKDDPEWRWKWVRSGLLQCKKGFETSDAPLDLANDIAFNLQLLMETAGIGRFDYDLISRIERDSELQNLLRAPEQEKSAEEGVTPFVLAIGWERYLKSKIQASYTTCQGIKLTPETRDGFIRHLSYCEAMYQWDRKKYQDAIGWLGGAANQCEKLLQMSQPSPKFKEWLSFYRALKPVVLLDERASSSNIDASERRNLLSEAIRKAEEALSVAKDSKEQMILDEGFVQEFIRKTRSLLK
jgi:hypothetical protein